MKMENVGAIAIAITVLIVAVVVGAEGNADQKVGRFLATQYKAVKCSDENGICESQSIVKLMCCKQSCVNVLTDVYNCGKCGYSCSFGYACCNGSCFNVASDPTNCGRCGATCTKCTHGMCSYA